MTIKELLNFLKELKHNNNREWYLANKSLFDEVKLFTRETAQSLINEISQFEPEAARLQPADCTYRIFRDTRFSSDKTPYKTHIGIFVNPPHGKKSLRMGYYLHLEPAGCFVAAGNIGYSGKLLAKIRQDIFDNVDEYLEIINNPDFKKFFPTVGEDLVKTAPKGFPSDWKHIDLIRPRNYIASYALKDSEVIKKDFISKVGEIFEITKPFNDFINYTVDSFNEEI